MEKNYIHINAASLKIRKVIGFVPKCYLYVNTRCQRMFQILNGKVAKSYLVSTSRFGTGSKEGSYQTPLGVHKIKKKIGENAPLGRIFRNRQDTGENWEPGKNDENIILTRILWLEGLEEGVNKGHGIDTFERYIYIHGTNREDLLGTPMSHGCICMSNKDVTELFNSVEEDTIVFID